MKYNIIIYYIQCAARVTPHRAMFEQFCYVFVVCLCGVRNVILGPCGGPGPHFGGPGPHFGGPGTDLEDFCDECDFEDAPATKN